jgi:ArsR family transcriptional regulator, arsenate/arsenite/antimonite-responsive transcriptional repressor
MVLTEPRAWREQADLLRGLAHPVRLALLGKLHSGPMCVSDIRDLLEVRQANLSQHLAVLRAAGLVDCHESGNLRCYYILRPRLVTGVLRLLAAPGPVRRLGATAVRRAAQARRAATSKRNTRAKP